MMCITSGNDPVGCISLGILLLTFLVLPPVMGFLLIFLMLRLLTLHIRHWSRIIKKCWLGAGALLTAAGIFAWVAAVAGWISALIGLLLMFSALAGILLLTSILALYLLALRGRRWSRITECAFTAGALLVTVAILIANTSAVISVVLFLLGVLLITSALLAELLATHTRRALPGGHWQWLLRWRWVLCGALLLGVAGLVLPGTIGDTAYGLAFLIWALAGLIWFFKNGIPAVRRKGDLRSFFVRLAAALARGVAFEAFWILAPFVLIFLEASGSVLVLRNESLPMTRATIVLLPAIFFLHTSPAWLSKSRPWDEAHKEVTKVNINRHLQAAHAAGAALFTCLFILMLRLHGAPLANKLGLGATIFASVGVLTLLTPVYRWIVQTVWVHGSSMIFSVEYWRTERSEWGQVLNAVHDAMHTNISKISAKSERSTSSDP